jgi:uncharacterized protein
VLIRLLIFAAVAYLIYRLLSRRRREGSTEPPAAGVTREDTLVQDPWCKTYVPLKQALEVESRGQVFHFCSPECRDRFLTQPQEPRDG